MLSSLILAVFIISGALSWFLTQHVRNYALGKNLLDIPNIRSSHSVPTPRGGGVAIVTVIFLSGILSFFLAGVDSRLILSLLFATLALAALGWQDDKHDLSAASRFLIQLLIAAVSVLLLLWDSLILSPSAGTMLLLPGVVLWVVWMANVYNFMDGIDGISAVESIVLSVTSSYWFATLGAYNIAIICIAVAGAAIGFLRWNWSPAKIFMGDVGSLALGGFFAALAIIGTTALEIPFQAFLILYAVYLADAGITLLTRMIKKEKWWQAHRSHFYQRAVQSGFSHAQVSLAVLAINIVFAVLASLLVAGIITAVTAIVVAIVILSLLMFLINSRFRRFTSK